MLHPVVRAAMEGCPCEHVAGATVRLTAAATQLIATLRQPPVYAAAQPVWYQCKALELAVTFLVQPEEEMFCTRQQRLAQERVEQVIFLLKQNLAEPPTLEELGKKIGCSHFYLSRIFSSADGPDHHAIPAAVAHGAGGGIAAGGRIQRDRGGAGGGLQQPQPFQRGVSRERSVAAPACIRSRRRPNARGKPHMRAVSAPLPTSAKFSIREKRR